MPPIYTRIQLSFSKALDLELLEKNVKVWLRRVNIKVVFRLPNGWSQPYQAIIDTGAPLSIIPPAIWEEIREGNIGF